LSTKIVEAKTLSGLERPIVLTILGGGSMHLKGSLPCMGKAGELVDGPMREIFRAKVDFFP
jgi:hypothetical protein